MTSPPAWLEPIDHTADAGFTVRAPDLPSLFARAAWALFAIITDPAAVRPAETLAVTVAAADREALLVRWLAELNFIHQTRALLFGDFAVTSLSDTQLTASVKGEKIDRGRHTVYTEIKAVTFHGLTVERQESGWLARVIVDV